MSKQNTTKPSRRSSGNPCTKYELAITNYVLGEKIDIPQKELFDHLAKCPSCQGDLRNWRATYATMRAKEYDARPEVQQRTQAFIHKLVTSEAQRSPDERRGQPIPAEVKPLPGGEILDRKAKIEQTAGMVWGYLAKNGWVKVKDLTRNLRQTDKIDPDETKFAVGWLFRENKVYYTKKKRADYVYLTEPERQTYQQSQKQV